MRRGLLYLLFVILASSCVSSPVQTTLDDVESYIMERPDSALSVLDSIDRDLLDTRRLRAQHALLHVMALDKNYIDVTDDSLALVALKYYSKKGPVKYEAMSLYYLGNSYYYSAEYDKAILYYTKAEHKARGADELYLGMIKMAQADTYSYTYNYIEEQNCLLEAYDIFESISDRYFLSLTKLRLAQVYYNQEHYEEAYILINELLSSDSIDDKIKAAATVTYAFICAIKENPEFEESALCYNKVIDEYDDSYLSYKDYWALAYSLSKTGQHSKSDEIIEQLDQIDSSGIGWYWKYLIEKSKGNRNEALRCLEKSTKNETRMVSEVLKQSLSSVQRDFYIAQYNLSEYKAKNRQLLLIITIVTSILIIANIIFFVSIYIRRQHKEKEYYLKYADEIYRQLEREKNEDYPELKKKYIALYHSRFETIGALYEQYTLFHGKRNEEKAIYDKVIALVNQFRNDSQDIEIFEQILNNDLDNIMLSLRTDMLQFKEIDFSIFRFLLIGFDVTVISHLLNMSMNAIYIRKSRMRRQIEESHSVRKEEYLRILSSKY